MINVLKFLSADVVSAYVNRSCRAFSASGTNDMNLENAIMCCILLLKLAKLVYMFFWCSQKYEGIVKIDKRNLPADICLYEVYCALTCLWPILQSMSCASRTTEMVLSSENDFNSSFLNHIDWPKHAVCVQCRNISLLSR